ncbi:MAG: hypothetical protein RJA22_2039 [Verrucomicrobiota bacterium]
MLKPLVALKRWSWWNLWLALAWLPLSAGAAGWTLTEGANPAGPGRRHLVAREGKPVAALVHGEGQFKPYLHVYGVEGELLTNGGLDKEGKPTGAFPHHRGIYIGWNQIRSELGGMDGKGKGFDLWHLNNGGRMEVQKVERLETGVEGVRFAATVVWRGGKKDASGSDVLLSEVRTFDITQPGGRTQVNVHFELKAARDLRLEGDLQHAGVHFRASNEVSQRAAETAYLWEPPLPGPGGKVSSKDLKWCRLVFPIGQRWYAATEINAPTNPVEELSWRDYGRFGFFFKRALQKDEVLKLDYRFLIEPAEAPAEKGKLSAAQAEQARQAAQADHAAFARGSRLTP